MGFKYTAEEEKLQKQQGLSQMQKLQLFWTSLLRLIPLLEKKTKHDRTFCSKIWKQSPKKTTQIASKHIIMKM